MLLSEIRALAAGIWRNAAGAVERPLDCPFSGLETRRWDSPRNKHTYVREKEDALPARRSLWNHLSLECKQDLTYCSILRRVDGFRIAKSISISSGSAAHTEGSNLWRMFTRWPSFLPGNLLMSRLSWCFSSTVICRDSSSGLESRLSFACGLEVRTRAVEVSDVGIVHVFFFLSFSLCAKQPTRWESCRVGSACCRLSRPGVFSSLIRFQEVERGQQAPHSWQQTDAGWGISRNGQVWNWGFRSPIEIDCENIMMMMSILSLLWVFFYKPLKVVSVSQCTTYHKALYVFFCWHMPLSLYRWGGAGSVGHPFFSTVQYRTTGPTVSTTWLTW